MPQPSAAPAPRRHIQGYIPIQPGLLHFVRWRENLTEGQPLALPGPGAIAGNLWTLFAFGLDFLNDAYEARENKMVDKLTARLPFTVAGHLAHHDIFLFAERVAVFFNDFVYDQLQDEIFIRVACGREAGVDGHTTMQRFAEKTGLDNYFDIEAIYRSQGRLRAYRNISIKKK